MELNPPSYVETPHVAYVNFFVGGECLTKMEDFKRPKALQSFTFSYGVDNPFTFKLQLLDPTWSEIENRVIALLNQDCTFWYGYENGTIRSREWHGFITSVIPSYTIDGILVTIEGCGTLGKLSLVKKTDSWPSTLRRESPMRPDEIVKKIAQFHGLKTTGESVEKCKQVRLVDSFDETNRIDMRFVQNRQTDLQFIKNVLCPAAISEKTGESGYIVFVDEKDTLYFRPAQKRKKPKEVFRYMRDKNSPVLSFEIDVDAGVLLSLSGYTKVQVPVIDPISGRQTLIEKFNENTPEKVKLAGYAVPNPEKVAIMTKKASGLVSTLPEKHPDVGEARAKTLFWKAWNSVGINGQLTIVGTDTDSIQPDNTCTVFVTQPDGQLHWTSGNYHILTKTDEISGGRWTTTLHLQREGGRNGGETAIAVDNTAV